MQAGLMISFIGSLQVDPYEKAPGRGLLNKGFLRLKPLKIPEIPAIQFNPDFDDQSADLNSGSTVVCGLMKRPIDDARSPELSRLQPHLSALSCELLAMLAGLSRSSV
jgi:hypothetical protein